MYTYEDLIKAQKNIIKFKNKLGPEMSEREISWKLFEMSTGIPIPVDLVEWAKSTCFYRARILNSTSLKVLKKWTKNDFWGVPKKLVSSYGRLNRPHESIFYLSNNLYQTLKEIRYKSNKSKIVVISCYETKKRFKSVTIGQNFTKDESYLGTIQNMYIDFFRDQFSKPVGKGTEYLYKLSNAIIKDFFDLPFEVSNAWTYPAVENKESLNVAFKSEYASEFLKYNGSIVINGEKNGGFKIPVCFNSNYQLCLPTPFWVEKIFKLVYKPDLE